MRLPRGLSVDASGNVLVADAGGHRVLRIGLDGTVTPVVGAGEEGFAGDGGAAVAALLDGPRAAGVSPAGLVTVADTRNQRVRQVDGSGVIGTLGGVGGAGGGALALTAPAVVGYGTGIVTASLTGATGLVTFLEVTGGSAVTLGPARWRPVRRARARRGWTLGFIGSRLRMEVTRGTRRGRVG